MTPTTPPLLDELRELDPAPSAELTPAQVERRHALLVRVTSDEHPTAASVPPRRSRRRSAVGALAGVSVAALAAAVFVGTLQSTSGAPVRSYALPAHGSLSSWTSTPSRADIGADDISACSRALGFSTEPELPKVLTSDQRGDFTSLMIRQNAETGYCVLAGGVVENWVDFSAVNAPPIRADDATYDVVQGADWMIAVSGRAGADVGSVAVADPETGRSVTATLADGTWAAWWPVTSGSLGSGPSAIDLARKLTIHFTTTDGQSHDSTGISDAEEGDGHRVTASMPPAIGTLSGWNAAASPATATAADIDSCAHAADAWAAGSSTSVLAESRGDYESLLIDHSGDEAYCVLKAGQIQWAREWGSRDDTSAVEVGVAALEQQIGLDGVVGASRIDAVQGVAGDGVTSVTVHLAGGHDVQAVVQNGRWMAWWPEDEPAALGGPTPQPTAAASDAPLRAGPPAISWTTTDGAAHNSP